MQRVLGAMDCASPYKRKAEGSTPGGSKLLNFFFFSLFFFNAFFKNISFPLFIRNITFFETETAF